MSLADATLCTSDTEEKKSNFTQKTNKNKSRYYKKQHNKYYRLCFSVIKDDECFNGGQCQFAHSLEDFNPKICRYDKDCKGVVKCSRCVNNTEDFCSCINDCSKLHPSFENKNDLLKRLGLFPRHLVKS